MNISIIFNAPSLEKNEHFIIMQNITDHLKELSEQLGNIESVEMKLYDTMEDHNHNNKAVLMSVKFRKETYTEYQVADRWDKVIIDAFHSLMAKGILRNLYQHI
jgi:hypothetical protein